MFTRKRYERAGDNLCEVLPGKKEGIEDGKIGPEAVAARLQSFPELSGIAHDDDVKIQDWVRDTQLAEKKSVVAEISQREAEIKKLNGPGPITVLVVMLALLVPLLMFAEADIAKNIAGFFGETDPFNAWLIGLALTAAPAILLKIALDPTEPVETRIGEGRAPWVLGAVSVVFIGVVAALRAHYLQAVEASRFDDGLLSKLVGNSPLLAGLGLFVLSLGVAGLTTFLWNRVSRYVRIQIHLYTLGKLRKRLKVIEISLAGIGALQAMRESRISHIVKSAIAEYQHGVAISANKVPSEVSVPKTVLTALALLGAAMMFAPAMYRACLDHGFGELPSLLMAGGLAMVIIATGLLFAMPNLKKTIATPASAQMVLPFASMSLVTCLLTGCGSSTAVNEARNIVMLVDESRSVAMTNEQIGEAVKTAVSPLDRCSTLTVVPVNARAGGIYEFTVPCIPAPYDDDIKAARKKLRSQLAVEIAAWRKADSQSDYVNALRLASERLALSRNRVLVILGDMVDDRGQDGSPRPKGPPTVPLIPEGFRGAKVYLGLVQSTELDHLTDEQRLEFEKNLRKAFVAAGVNDQDFTFRAFGLQGLDAWADHVLGPPKVLSGVAGSK